MATFKDQRADPATLVPYERNAKKHPPEQVRLLRKLIDEHGFTMPILVDEGREIIVGHGRQLAALLDPPMATVPVRVAIGLDDTQKRALRIADNKVALLGDWMPGVLHDELNELSDLGVELADMGFSDDDLARLSDDAAEAALGDGAGSSSGSTDPDPDLDQGESVQLHLPMRAEARRAVFDAIEAAKALHGIEVSGDALEVVCREFIQRHPAA